MNKMPAMMPSEYANAPAIFRVSAVRSAAGMAGPGVAPGGAGFQVCPEFDATEAHAAQQRCNHHERVWQCDFQVEPGSKFQGRVNGDCTSNTPTNSGLTGVGICGV